MTVLSLIGYTLAGIGTALIGIAAVGLIRLPDAYNRANAVAKAAALGVVGILLGVLALNPTPFNGVMLVGGAIMQLLTTPFAAYALGRAAHRSGAPRAPSTHHDDLLDHHT